MKKIFDKEVIVYHANFLLLHFQENEKTTVFPILISRFKAWFRKIPDCNVRTLQLRRMQYNFNQNCPAEKI